jgi:hypothetical protein
MERVRLALVLASALLSGCSPSPARRSVAPPGPEPAAVAPEPPAAAVSPASRVRPPHAVDFAHDVRPILEARCQPCHFPGGKMYDRLPFDQAQTVRDLGPKLFTRIKTPEEQEAIRQFLAQQP